MGIFEFFLIIFIIYLLINLFSSSNSSENCYLLTINKYFRKFKEPAFLSKEELILKTNKINKCRQPVDSDLFDFDLLKKIAIEIPGLKNPTIFVRVKILAR